jgi:hypothetical protein
VITKGPSTVSAWINVAKYTGEALNALRNMYETR